MIMLSNITLSIITIIVTLIITMAQKYLSTRKLWQLGAVVPLLSIAAMAVLYFTMKASLSDDFIIPCIILLAIELFVWIDGRTQYRKDELRKMTAKDID